MSFIVLVYDGRKKNFFQITLFFSAYRWSHNSPPYRPCRRHRRHRVRRTRLWLHCLACNRPDRRARITIRHRHITDATTIITITVFRTTARSPRRLSRRKPTAALRRPTLPTTTANTNSRHSCRRRLRHPMLTVSTSQTVIYDILQLKHYIRGTCQVQERIRVKIHGDEPIYLL